MNFNSNYSSVASDIKSGKITVSSIVNNYLKKIEESRHLNIFVNVFSDSARAKAIAVDEKIKTGKAGKLAGMVIAIKDNICYKDHPVSASSKILENFISPYHSTVVERLLAEDAILIGSTNCDEFAMGSSNETSYYGKVLNPLDTERVPGGSSGGSAAAVAAGLCMAALGTDTGGSVRQPAAYCGLVGLKPTYGRISRYGIIAYASSFDQVGPITHTVDDMALIMEVISGKDEFDGTVSTCAADSYSEALTKSPDIKNLKVAYIKETLENEGLDPEIKEAIQQKINFLKNQGAVVEPVSFPYLDYMVPAYYILTTAEASSNLARYDGIRYGYRSPNATDLESTYKKSRTEGFGKEVKRRIMLGTFVLSAGYYDAYYSKAQKVRRLLRDKTYDIFNHYNFILLPTTPGTAFKFGEKSKDPIKMYLEDIFTVQANLTGIPAISIPAGKAQNGMPFGLQIYSANFSEKELLTFAKYLS